MGRFRAGLITGLIGAVIIAFMGLLPTYVISLLGFILAIIVGVIAGNLVAHAPKFAGKTGGAGALAGLLAGTILLIGQIIAGVVFVNSPNGQQILVSLQQTIEPTLTAIASNGGNSSGNVSSSLITTAAGAGIVFTECIVGLFDLGLATAFGAIAGAIAGRKNQPPAPQMMPFGYQQNPGYPPQYPQNPPQGGYGSSTYQPPYPQQPPQPTDHFPNQQ